MEGIWRWQTSRMRRRMLWWWRWSLPNARRLPHLRCEVTVYSPGCSLESCVFSLDRLYFKPDFWIQFVQNIILLTVWIMMLTDGWVEAEQIWCNLPGSCVCVLQLYAGDLESEFSQFQDWLQIFPLYKGKACGEDDEEDEEERLMGKYKVWWMESCLSVCYFKNTFFSLHTVH